MYFCYYDDFKNHIFLQGKTEEEAKSHMIEFLDTLTNSRGTKEFSKCFIFQDQLVKAEKWIRSAIENDYRLNFSIIDHDGHWHQFGKIDNPLILIDPLSKPYQIYHEDNDQIHFCNCYRNSLRKIVLEIARS